MSNKPGNMERIDMLRERWRQYACAALSQLASFSNRVGFESGQASLESECSLAARYADEMVRLEAHRFVPKYDEREEGDAYVFETARKMRERLAAEGQDPAPPQRDGASPSEETSQGVVTENDSRENEANDG